MWLWCPRILLFQLYYNVANGVWAGIVMRWPGGLIGQKSGPCRLNDPSQLMPHPDYITIHNTNMCMWALSHTYTCVICVHAHRHTDIQTYRPKVCIWKQHNSHALVSTLSTFSFFAPFIPLFIPKIATFHSISFWQCVLCLCVCVYVHAFSKSAISSLTWCDCACVFLCLFVVCVSVCVCLCLHVSVLCVVCVCVCVCVHAFTLVL